MQTIANVYTINKIRERFMTQRPRYFPQEVC